MKKKVLAMILVLIMIVGVLPVTAMAAEVAYPVTGGNIYFDKSLGWITGWDESVTEIIIPSYIDGVKVRDIDWFTYENCSNLKKLTIPNDVNLDNIGKYTFCGSKITDLVIPGNIRIIGEGAFAGCENLKSLTFLEGVTSIGPLRVFMGCTNLTSVTIPKSLRTIGLDTFYGCDNIKDVYYEGSKSDWEKMLVWGGQYADWGYDEISLFDRDTGNEPLLNATIHFNSTGPENSASTPVKVIVNGTELSTDQPAVIINDRTLVPLRAIFEAIGATVDWDGDTKTVTSTKGDISIYLKIGDKKLYKNGSSTTLDVPAQIINNRTMVPARAVSEAFGCEVGWNNKTKTVTITG